jgi:hypothetical protein
MQGMDTSALAIACVLKTGRWHTGHNHVNYQPKHVQWLKRQCDQYAPGVRFVCLTNESTIDGVETIPLRHNWPGWWSKIELFGHDLGRVLYMDLDTVIVGPLDEMLAYPHQFTALNSLGKKSVRLLNSGLMAWQGARPDLFEPFARDPQRWIKECVTGKCWGDQGFISRHIGHKWEAWQNLFPGSVGSYKNTWNRKRPPHEARIVCFHGTPKPYEVSHDWVPKC